jgi:hypothetical protein
MHEHALEHERIVYAALRLPVTLMLVGDLQVAVVLGEMLNTCCQHNMSL